MESLVIVDQHATVNMFPGFVHTARQGLKASAVLSFFYNKSFPFFYFNLIN